MDSIKSTNITREELYRQVWETPMLKLASRYGLSDNGLAKICRRLNIPYPGRGFWRKKETGKKVKAKPLPENTGKFPQSVHITPTPRPGPEDIEVMKKRDAEAAKVLSAIREKAVLIPIAVPKQKVTWHPVLLRLFDWWKDRLSRFDPTPLQKRQYRILNALFRELEKHGGKACWGEVWRERRGYRGSRDSGIYLSILGERLDYELGETEQYVRTPLTEEDKKWMGHRRKWRHEYVPTGLLYFKIKTYISYGFPREWEETPETPLESYLPEIAATCIAAHPFLEASRKEEEREERARRIREEKVRRAERRQRIRKKQWELFLNVSRQWEDVQRARSLLDCLTKEGSDRTMRIGKKDVGEWVRWLEENLQREELKYSARSIFTFLASAKEY